jgi:hypothetical protein
MGDVQIIKRRVDGNMLRWKESATTADIIVTHTVSRLKRIKRKKLINPVLGRNVNQHIVIAIILKTER